MLNPTFTLGSLDLTASPYAVEFGADLGAPENVYEVLMTALADGEAVTSDRVSNRSLTLTVLVEGATMQALADAEKALLAETEKVRNVLTIDPGDEVGPPTAFDTFRAQAVLVRNDDEEQHFLRRFTLTIPALPHGRSVTLTTTTSTPIVTTPTYVSIYNAAGNSGWTAIRKWATSGSEEASTATNGGASGVYAGDGNGYRRYRLTRSASVSMSGNNYLVIEWIASYYGGSAPRVGLITDPGATRVVDGVPYNGLPLSGYGIAGHVTPSPLDVWPTATLVQEKVTVDGWNRSTYFIPGDLPNGFALNADNDGTPFGNLFVRKVERATAPEGVGSPRQQNVSFEVGGSVRTQGSISVAHATSALGATVVYTAPAGSAAPALSPFFTSGPARSTDVNAVSGKTGAISGSGAVFGIPASQVRDGRAQLWAYVKAASAGTYPLAWAIGNAPTGSLTFDAAWNTSGTTNVTLAANTWTLVPVAEAPSKFRNVGPNGFVRVGIANASVTLDEAWLFVLDDAALTVVDAGVATPAAGGSSNRVWIDAPSLDRPQGGLYQGTLSTRADEHYMTTIQSFMDHNFDPAGMSAFVVTTNAQAPTVTLTHYRRWHTSAAS